MSWWPAAAGWRATEFFIATRGWLPRPPDLPALGAQRWPLEGARGVADGHLWTHPSGRDTVLLVHGWGADSSTMHGFVRPLAANGLQAAAFDAPGHGASPGDSTTMSAFKDAVKAAVLQRDTRIRAVIAHSLGGLATLAALAELGEHHHVRAVCLLGMPCTLSGVIERWSHKVLHLRPPVMRALHDQLHRRSGLPVDYWDARALAAGLHIPMLLLHDPNDKVVPATESEQIVKALPLAQYEAVDSGGHSGLLSNAQTVQQVARFIAATVLQAWRDAPFDLPSGDSIAPVGAWPAHRRRLG